MALSWENTSGIATGYKVFYGTSPSGGQAFQTDPSDSTTDILPNDTESCHISGLQPNTQYYFRVVATNDAGDSDPGTATATTPNVATPPGTGGIDMDLDVDEDNNNFYNPPDQSSAENSGAPKYLAMSDGENTVPPTPAYLTVIDPTDEPALPGDADVKFTFGSWLQVSTSAGGSGITSNQDVALSSLTQVSGQTGVYEVFLKAVGQSDGPQSITVASDWSGGGGSVPPPANPTTAAVASGPQATLYQLSYGGTLFHTILKDDGSGAYGGVQWGGSDSNSFPVAYTMSGTKAGADFMTITAQFTLSAGVIPGASYKILATTQGSSTNPFGKTTVFTEVGNAQADGDTVIGTVTSQNPLASQIMETNTVLKWEISSDNGLNYTILPTPTSTPTYVIRGNPTTDQYLTAIDIGCRDGAGQGISDPVNVLNAIWNDFINNGNPLGNGAGVKNAAGLVLTYYHAGAKLDDACRRLPGLMATHDGRCGAWADLLTAVLLDQGIDAVKVEITPKIIPAGAVGVLVVKPALPGQGSTIPNANVFNDHAVVRISGLDNASNGSSADPGLLQHASTIYDPSYGKSYGGPGVSLPTAKQQWRDAAEASVGYQFPGDLPALTTHTTGDDDTNIY